MLVKPKGPVVLYGAFVRAWTQLTGLALFALGARILGVSEFGVFALAAVFINIVQTFLYSGIYEFVMRARTEDQADHTALVLNLSLSCIGIVISTGVGWLVAVATHQPEVFRLAASMAPSALVAGVAAWHEAQILRRQAYALYYATWVAGETIAAAFGALLLLKGAHIYSLVGYRYMQSSLMLAGYLLFGPVPYLGRVYLSKIPAILRFAGPIYGSRLLNSLANYGADLVVGVLLGPAATGLYRMANRVVASVSEAIYQPLRMLTWTRAARARGSLTKTSLALLPLLNIATLLMWPTAAILSYAAKDILRIGLGAKWEPAAPIIAMLFLARSVEVGELFFEPILANTAGGRRLIMVRTLAIAVLMIALLALAPLGPSYVGLANLAAALVPLATVFPPLIRTLGVSRVLAAMTDGTLLVGVSAAIMALSRLADPGGGSLLIHVAVVGACSLALLAMLFRRRQIIIAMRR
jgi:O-antigen/teichoic acid export membrane protein